MTRVALGMSGGIDSTMSALILQEQGFEVIGLTMSFWDPSIKIAEQTKKGCFGPGEAENLEAAKLAAKKLGIEHHVIPLSGEFRTHVLGFYTSTYLMGKTPNPCSICNPLLKFGLLPQAARSMGLSFDYFATGHYARKHFDEKLKRWQILRGVDKSKDQSYFLSLLSQEQIAQAIFPLGEMHKVDLKAFARLHGFEYLVKKQESQDFLQTEDHSVLFETSQIVPGRIVDFVGRELGTHRGLIHYTIGQRKNLGVAGMPEPYYVIRLDAEKNELVLGPVRLLYSDSLIAEKLNWVSIEPPIEKLEVTAKIRFAHEPAAATLELMDTQRVKFNFQEPQLSITPGQLVVFYRDDLLLGGGFIA